MQHVKPILPLLSLVALVATVSAEASPEAAYGQLCTALSQELTALESVTDAASAAAAYPSLEEAIRTLASMERSYEAEKELWVYIDNTEGVKTPLLELLQRLAVEFTRLENASFYGHEGVAKLLAPQLTPPAKESE